MRYPVLNESKNLRYFAFFYLYVMQGIPSGFALTAVANFLVGKGVTSQAVGTFVAIVGIPWILQFIWGPLIDRYQYSVIGHRKQWVVLTQFIACAASLTLLLVHNPVQQIGLMSVVFFTHSIFASIQDASVDAIAIDIVPEEQRGRVNAFMRGGYLMGVSFGAAALSGLLHKYGFFYAALFQSVCLFLLTVLTVFIKLDKNDRIWPRFGVKKEKKLPHENPDLKWLFKQLYAGIMEKASLQQFLGIAAVYFFISVFIRSYTFHLIHVLRWPDHDVSVLQGSWGSIATAFVAIIGGVIADKIGPEKLLVRVIAVLAVFLLAINGLAYFWFLKPFTTSGLILWNMADPMFSVAAMPLLMALCRDKVEGSQFTAYMALVNFCDVLGSYVSGWGLTVFSAPQLGFCCGLGAVLVLILKRYQSKNLPLIPHPL